MTIYSTYIWNINQESSNYQQVLQQFILFVLFMYSFKPFFPLILIVHIFMNIRCETFQWNCKIIAYSTIFEICFLLFHQTIFVLNFKVLFLRCSFVTCLPTHESWKYTQENCKNPSLSAILFPGKSIYIVDNWSFYVRILYIDYNWPCNFNETTFHILHSKHVGIEFKIAHITYKQN